MDFLRENPQWLARVGVAGAAYSVLAWLLGGFHHHPWQLPAVVLRVIVTANVTLFQFLARGCKPRFPEWTLGYELTRALVHDLLSNYGDRVCAPRNAAFIRRQSELLGNVMSYFANKANHTRIDSFSHNGLEHLWVRAARTPVAPTHRVVVLYFHGGGYVLLSPRMYAGFASELQSRIQRLLCEKLEMSDQSVQVDILLANYRKAPEHRYPTPPLDALTMYKYLLEHEKLQPSQIIVMGDSAGGGLTMTTMLRLRDEDPSRLPLAGILSCPFVDREISGDERRTPYCILTDLVIKSFGDAYFLLKGPPSSWGDASPYHCDLRGLPPVYIQAAELDYILAHSKRLITKAHESGLKTWKLEIFPNMPHVFTTTPPSALPMAGRGLDAMAEYAASQFSVSRRTQQKP